MFLQGLLKKASKLIISILWLLLKLLLKNNQEISDYL